MTADTHTQKKQKYIRHQGGFTLIETLVAVLILASAIAGPLSIAAHSLSNSLVAKDQIVAFYLAGDAVEYVRYIRDTNRLLGADWLDGSGGTAAGTDLTPCQDAKGCYVDTTGNTYVDSNSNTPNVPVVCPASCPVMDYDSTNTRFTYESVNTVPLIMRSPFTRKIYLNPISATEQQLTVTISWKDMGSTTRSINVTENIFAWQ